MKTIRAYWEQMSVAERVHLALIAFWTVLILPIYFWFRDNIFVVLLISIYANIATHWSALQGAKAERNSPDA